ncbi:hypothetical protein C463_00680 [Halorubrum californiense DSM 19288]|uniref:Nucleic acid-binding protein n=1 Tax=Halorubrum californiense DSM 19288 TaxID=1227465 RepID=M0ELD2_9EURY|nr:MULTISPECIES: zinc ribbon domain-containing protein [Halorubrum]ELZ48535.1 hypothetical protein C463_00680 [Halorubrum californiense DSM 19288]TKX65634.1 hypothetical protein EXE40_16670 [Halorubrum sp. GN11GM_10-3_MGM]
MPSETDDTKYSVFDDEEAAETETSDRGDPDARADDRPQSLGGDGDDGCPKCGGTEAETDEIATSGTGLTKLFDVQNRKFLVVSCAECGYSELYKGQSSGNAIDFFLG